MIVLDDDHTEYLVAGYDSECDDTQPLQFTRWGRDGIVLRAGTTCEELLRVLIDRVKHMNDKQASEIHSRTLGFLRMALMGLEMRAAEKNGIRLVTLDFNNIENITVCPICGHIACEHKEQAAKEITNA